MKYNHEIMKIGTIKAIKTIPKLENNSILLESIHRRRLTHSTV